MSGPLREATWREGAPPALPRPHGVAEWWRVIRRAVPALLVLLLGEWLLAMV